MRVSGSLCLGLVLCFSAPAFAQSPFVVRAWSTEEGLPQNTVNRLLQTRDGYLWLGTFGGLVRFDGLRFTIYTSANTPALKSNRILSLLEDRTGTLWIGADGGGLTRYRRGEFTTYPTAIIPSTENAAALLEDRGGTLWVATQRRLLRAENASLESVDAAGLPSDITTLLESPDDRLWIGGIGGLVSMDMTALRGGGRVAARRWTDLPVSSLALDPGNTVWAAGENGLVNVREGKVTIYERIDGERLDQLWTVLADPDGSLWLGSGGGVLRLRDDRIMRYRPVAGGGDNTVRSLLFDREGSLWVGTDVAGLRQWRPRTIRTVGADEGLAAPSVRTALASSRGGVWVGTWCGGLYYVEERGEALRAVASPGRGCISALHEDRDGVLWIGTQSGLFRYAADGMHEYQPRDGLPHARVSSLYRDRAGVLWVGTVDGLGRLDGGRFTVYRAADGLVHNDVRAIEEDHTGALWIGTLGGLSRLQNGAFTNFTTANGLTHDFVRAVHEAADGTLWIGTYGGGLLRFRDGGFRAFTTRDGLVEDFVSVILEDAAGHFWLTGNRGVSRIARRDLDDYAAGLAPTLSPVTFSAADGMRNSETNGGSQPAGTIARDGSLWVPTIDGVAIIDPAQQLNTIAPPVVIEDVRVDDRPMPLEGGIDLPAGTHNLEIRYAGLGLSAPERLRFRFRLDGYDDGWVNAGSRRSAFYTGLPPGRYTFQVTASNSHGVWNESGAVLPVRQIPFFYQTVWFAGSALLIVGLTAVGSYRLRVWQLVRAKETLERNVADRTAALEQQRGLLADANEQLATANDHLGRANAQMLGAFDQLQLGVIVTDADARVVFVSAWAQRLLTRSVPDAIGQHWHECLPLDDQQRGALRAAAHAVATERQGRIPLTIAATSGRRYSLEVEVKPDPGDLARRIFYFYDVTELYDLRRLRDDRPRFHDLVGDSAAMRLLYRQIRDVGPADATVLVEGETGTGKELVAQALHAANPRRTHPFVPVNCAGLTESLLSSQLFGHRRGAFTGAISDQPGVFEAAHGGTIFLDEIGDMPMPVQTMLLRVLQEKEITRVGDSRARRVDVRVIAATHRDLAEEVRQGRFREDLLYRIRVFRIHVPPLRERRQDIPALVSWFLHQAPADRDAVREVSSGAMDALVAYDWPGNVRELRSAIEAAAIRARHRAILPIDLPIEVAGRASVTAADTERSQAIEALKRTDGNRSEAARLLGVSRSTFYRRLRAFGLVEAGAGDDAESDRPTT